LKNFNFSGIFPRDIGHFFLGYLVFFPGFSGADDNKIPNLGLFQGYIPNIPAKKNTTSGATAFDFPAIRRLSATLRLTTGLTE